MISNLGGERREVACPWCEGSGEFKPEHDAQEHAPEVPAASGAGDSAGTPSEAKAEPVAEENPQ